MEKKIDKSLYEVRKMDCPCEERIIRMAMEDLDFVVAVECDLEQRLVWITHRGGSDSITAKLDDLHLGAKFLETVQTEFIQEAPNKQRNVLIVVLIINFTFFLVEMLSGMFANSMGLVADSLDMLADALVYGMSLFVVGAALKRKKRVAALSGYIQILLAVWGFIEVVRRFIGVEEMPDFRTMIGVSFLALIANAICLWLLQRTRSRDAHMRASMIFSANDVIINFGVICAGVMVKLLNNGIPDLIIGIIVFAVVIRGAVRILKLSK